MFFLRPKLLELFTCLIFNFDKRCVRLDDVFFKTNDYGTWDRSISDPVFWCNLKDHFYISKIENKSSIELKDRERTLKFLKEYLLKYKKGELGSPPNNHVCNGVEYYSYVENLYKMDKVLNHFSQGEFYFFSANSAKVCMEKMSSIGDSKIRFAEFLLDLYFYYGESFDIKKCEIVKIRRGLQHLYTLQVELSLNEHPSKLPAHLHKKLDDVELSELKSNKIGALLKDDMELKIVKLVAQGYSQLEISQELKFEVSAVKKKLGRIYKKLAEYYPQFRVKTRGKDKLLRELYEKELNRY